MIHIYTFIKHMLFPVTSYSYFGKHIQILFWALVDIESLLVESQETV